MQQVPFASLLGSLLYIGNTTRGDILQAVNRLGRFTANPGKVHWQALKRVLVSCTILVTGVLCLVPIL